VKIVSNSEITAFFESKHQVPAANLLRMNKSGTLSFPFGTITMVGADHSSTCGLHDGILIDGGNAAGFVVKFKECGQSVYHSGDTGIFGDMVLIDELYKPTTLLLATGGHYTMGP
jgi:L-ascorbate metabolism protein UlaG (beta-lactamase superfamily)